MSLLWLRLLVQLSDGRANRAADGAAAAHDAMRQGIESVEFKSCCRVELVELVDPIRYIPHIHRNFLIFFLFCIFFIL